MSQTASPSGTFHVASATTGDCYVPDAFQDDLTRLLAALDWSRVFNGTRAYGPLANELAAARRHALALADLCESFATGADRLREVQGQD